MEKTGRVYLSCISNRELKDNVEDRWDVERLRRLHLK